jgi:hypothetical protein
MKKDVFLHSISGWTAGFDMQKLMDFNDVLFDIDKACIAYKVKEEIEKDGYKTLSIWVTSKGYEKAIMLPCFMEY